MDLPLGSMDEFLSQIYSDESTALLHCCLRFNSTKSSFSFRSGLVEQKEHTSECENCPPFGNVTTPAAFHTCGEYPRGKLSSRALARVFFFRSIIPERKERLLEDYFFHSFQILLWVWKVH